MGNRVLTLEVHSPDKLPPNTLSLSYGAQNMVLFTVPGTDKTNQELAFIERKKKQQERADEQENIKQREIEEEEARKIAREEENSDNLNNIQRNHSDISQEISTTISLIREETSTTACYVPPASEKETESNDEELHSAQRITK